MNNSRQYRNPDWWNESHSSGWERSKEAFRREWEQTKSDLGDGGDELDGGSDDAVGRDVGDRASTPGNASRSGDDSWDDVEPAFRYGYGARQHYAERGEEWNDDLESQLKNDWDSSGEQRTWDRVKNAVRRGWDSMKSAAL